MHKVSQDIWQYCNMSVLMCEDEDIAGWLDLAHHENIFYGITS